MINEIKKLIEKAEEAGNKEDLKDLNGILKRANYLEGLEDIVTNEMMKEDDESDLLIIGEKVVSYLGYW